MNAGKHFNYVFFNYMEKRLILNGSSVLVCGKVWCDVPYIIPCQKVRKREIFLAVRLNCNLLKTILIKNE